MNLLKNPRLFSLILSPVVAIGLFFALQTNPQNSLQESPIFPPGTITPDDQGAGAPSIIPSDRDPSKIEYRNIIFRGNGADKAVESSTAPGA